MGTGASRDSRFTDNVISLFVCFIFLLVSKQMIWDFTGWRTEVTCFPLSHCTCTFHRMNHAELLIRELVTRQRFVQHSTVREGNAFFNSAKMTLLFASMKITDVSRHSMIRYHMDHELNSWLTNKNIMLKGRDERLKLPAMFLVLYSNTNTCSGCKMTSVT